MNLAIQSKSDYIFIMQKHSHEVIREIVHLLNQNGIQTEAIYEPIGCPFHPSPQDIVAMIEDRDAFFAAECGLDKKMYQEWKECVTGGFRCTAQNRSGSTCRKRIRDYQNLSPQAFAQRKADNDLVCSVHQKKG